MPLHSAPVDAFIPGGNGVGLVQAVGAGVWHLAPGQPVVISSHLTAAENVPDPAQILVGITSHGASSASMQAEWPNGTLADYALLPASVLTSCAGLASIDATTLATVMRYVVPFGGLYRGALQAGETVVVSGAIGNYGTAAVRLALAMGAGRVVAVGRNRQVLQRLVETPGERVIAVAATGDGANDASAIREAAGGGAHLALDIVGGARDPRMTLAVLRSLRRGGRLVLMGSMSAPLTLDYDELMLNSWSVSGQFMYPKDSDLRVLDLVRAGLLDLRAIRPEVFDLHRLPDAMRRAAEIGPFDCVVMRHSPPTDAN